MTNQVLPPYNGGLSSLSAGTYNPTMGLSADNHTSRGGIVYPFTFKGGKRKTKKTKRKWSLKYKKSINCKRPKGFSQRQYCKGKPSKGKPSKGKPRFPFKSHPLTLM